jgi:hypothetical protein
MRMTLLLAILLACSTVTPAVENEHVELGTVSWLRDYQEALSRASETGKPVLILFQEVPGCLTCRNYGLQVLSHPLLAEAAETEFVPLAIFNNRGGADREVLSLFGEPSWNNPVVRVVDSRERELGRRLAGDYTPGGLSGLMIQTLAQADRPIPRYLRLVHGEFVSAARRETALFSMFCFWQGEVDLGGLEGVVATRSGFMQGSEVVEVEFDTARTGFAQLLREARKLRCADRVFPRNEEQRRLAHRILGPERVGTLGEFTPDHNIKYYLSRTSYRYLPMTDYQQVLVNRLIYLREDPARVLSPRQRAMAARLQGLPRAKLSSRVATGHFGADWKEVSALLVGGD